MQNLHFERAQCNKNYERRGMFFERRNSFFFFPYSQGKGECLEDEPADNDYSYPDLPPGAMYNAEHQCRLQFGVREASVCSPLQEVMNKSKSSTGRL